jgi:hypothetical protein
VCKKAYILCCRKRRCGLAQQKWIYHQYSYPILYPHSTYYTRYIPTHLIKKNYYYILLLFVTHYIKCIVQKHMHISAYKRKKTHISYTTNTRYIAHKPIKNAVVNDLIAILLSLSFVKYGVTNDISAVINIIQFATSCCIFVIFIMFVY